MKCCPKMKSDTFSKLAEFIVSEREKYRKPFSVETTLEGDLGISGDDADDFMHSFFTHFNVDSHSFSIDKYFYGEGIDFINITGFIKRILGKKSEDNSKYDLTLSDLINAIEKGSWTDIDM